MFNHFFLYPGQGFQTFTHMRNTVQSSSGGRPRSSSELTEVGTYTGLLTITTPIENEKWGTTEHPITHKIIHHGRPETIPKVNDVLTLGEDDEKRFFYVQRTPRNPGDLNHFIILYVDERVGIHE